MGPVVSRTANLILVVAALSADTCGILLSRILMAPANSSITKVISALQVGPDGCFVKPAFGLVSFI